ncbi:hypothetical protein K3495_g8899 [Podosphaera aphanis]|nr:hypothetical protein K3495_g8899 [Podosphaera aphanis]
MPHLRQEKAGSNPARPSHHISRLVMLEKPSFIRWRFLVEQVFRNLHIENYIFTVLPELRIATAVDVIDTKNILIKDQDSNIKAALATLVPEEIFYLIHGKETSKEMWDALNQCYEHVSQDSVVTLLQDFWSFPMEDGSDVDKIAEQLIIQKTKISSIDIAQGPTENLMKSRLLGHFDKCCNGQASYDNRYYSDVVSYVNESTDFSSWKGKTCAFCKHLNHTRETCFAWLDTPDGTKWAAKNPPKADVALRLKEKYGKKSRSPTKSANPDNESSDEGAWIVEEQALSSIDCPKNCDVILDTGATHHIFHDRSSFTSFYPTNKMIQTASGNYSLVTAVGSVQFSIYSFKDSSKFKFSPPSSSGKGSDSPLDFKPLTTCDVCNSCKQVENINRSPSTRSSTTLELIYSDTWDKCRIPGIFGSLYFVSFRDDSSRESGIFLLKSTKEVKDSFAQCKEKKELQTGCNIKVMRFDGGMEYKLIDFGGIVEQISAPYTQHQNGVSERLNRILVTIARCMLAHSGLPLRFGDAAILTACYLRNRLPLFPNKQSPYESINKIEPKVSHLRVWGCVCYVLIDTLMTRIDLSSHQRHSKVFLLDIVNHQHSTKYMYRLKREETRLSYPLMCVFFENSFWDWSMSSSEQYGEIDTIPEGVMTVISSSPPSDNPDSEGDEPGTSETLTSQSPPPIAASPSSISIISPVTSLVPTITITPPLQLESTASKRTPKPIPPRSAWQTNPRAFYVGTDIPIPQSFKEAIEGPNNEHWKTAIHDELQSLEEKNVFSFITHVPHERRPIGSRWGFSQIHGVDYLETCSPTLRANSLRILLSIATFRDWEIHQVDVKTAYLEGDLEEEVFMKTPEVWYAKLDAVLHSLDFNKSGCDSCIYINKTRQLVLGVYIDDLVICGQILQHVKDLKTQLSSYFPIKDLEEIGIIIGWRISRDRENRVLQISQAHYVMDNIRSFGLEDAKSYTSPLEGYKGVLPADEDEPLADESAYSSAIGSLDYAANGTRPDISFATSQLASHNSSSAPALEECLKGT